jgi:ATP/maltotriose-dependent transcriptional regulator MalT
LVPPSWPAADALLTSTRHRTLGVDLDGDGGDPAEIVRDEMWLLASLAQHELDAGHLARAGRLALRSLSCEALLDGDRVLGPHHVWGAVLGERDDQQGAATSLEVAIERADAGGLACCRIAPRLTLAELRTGTGDTDGGRAVLAEAHAIDGGMAGVLGDRLLATEITLALGRADLRMAQQTIPMLREPARARLQARFLAAMGEHDEALAVLAGIAEPTVGDRLDHLLLTARCCASDDGKLQLVRDAVMAAERDGYVRRFVSEGSWLAPLLRCLAASWPTSYVLNLLTAMGATQSPPATRVRGANLTAREWEVLGYLGTRLPIDQIGGRLFISQNTVKTHIRNIYQKLGVRSRLEVEAWQRHLTMPADTPPER